MAHSISGWFSTTFQWVHFLKESARLSYSGLRTLYTASTGNDAHKRKARVLSPEEEIIIQMGKDYPGLFIT